MSRRIGKKLLHGWRMMEDCCDVCHAPYLENPSTLSLWCPGCQKYIDEESDDEELPRKHKPSAQAQPSAEEAVPTLVTTPVSAPAPAQAQVPLQAQAPSAVPTSDIATDQYVIAAIEEQMREQADVVRRGREAGRVMGAMTMLRELEGLRTFFCTPRDQRAK